MWVIARSPARLLLGCNGARSLQLWNLWLAFPSVLISVQASRCSPFCPDFPLRLLLVIVIFFLLSVCPWLLLPHLPLQSICYCHLLFPWYRACCVVYLLYLPVITLFFPPAIYLISIHHLKKRFSFTLPVDFPLRVFTSGKGQIMLSCCKILIILINASNGLNSVPFFNRRLLSRCPLAVGLLEKKSQMKKQK